MLFEGFQVKSRNLPFSKSLLVVPENAKLPNKVPAAIAAAIAALKAALFVTTTSTPELELAELELSVVLEGVTTKAVISSVEMSGAIYHFKLLSLVLTK